MDKLPFPLLTALVVFMHSWTMANCYMWDHLSLKYGLWYQPPKTPSEAIREGYTKRNHICKMDTYHGFLFQKENSDVSRLIFDLNDKLSGIQTVIPGNMIGFNSHNETIKLPPADVIPPILLSTETNFRGVQMYIITAYFKHPSLICSPYAYNVHPGKGLYIQMGYNVEKQFERIPLEARRLSSQWKQGSCIPKMGLHYFKNLTPRQPCEKLYPVFLMYNSQGQLGAFGWLFQGTPPTYKYNNDELKWFKLSPPYYPFTFQTKQLPACMYNPEFRVFGLHIWLRNADNMLCPVPTKPPQPTQPQPRTRPVVRTTQSPDNNNIIVIEDTSSANRLSSNLVLVLVTVCLVVVLLVQADLNVLRRHKTTKDSLSGLS